MAKVAVARRKAKRLAGASVVFSAQLDRWLQTLYSVVNGTVAPFGMQLYSTEAEALAAADEVLKTKADDWAEVPETDIESHILEHTRNQWST